ncbi:hypothetical protein CSUI_005904 [Cystoisospora suis]|uniref:Uncharacterized protein n=1 Tax=Cystoisospora suis TaxID=483139 RepID=A0A2C6KVY4_9APIC|nr:hypothetical protein CSUI_005904 [Cystoisospora suis]
MCKTGISSLRQYHRGRGSCLVQSFLTLPCSLPFTSVLFLPVHSTAAFSYSARIRPFFSSPAYSCLSGPLGHSSDTCEERVSLSTFRCWQRPGHWFFAKGYRCVCFCAPVSFFPSPTICMTMAAQGNHPSLQPSDTPRYPGDFSPGAGPSLGSRPVIPRISVGPATDADGTAQRRVGVLSGTTPEAGRSDASEYRDKTGRGRTSCSELKAVQRYESEYCKSFQAASGSGGQQSTRQRVRHPTARLRHSLSIASRLAGFAVVTILLYFKALRCRNGHDFGLYSSRSSSSDYANGYSTSHLIKPASRRSYLALGGGGIIRRLTVGNGPSAAPQTSNADLLDEALCRALESPTQLRRPSPAQTVAERDDGNETGPGLATRSARLSDRSLPLPVASGCPGPFPRQSFSLRQGIQLTTLKNKRTFCAFLVLRTWSFLKLTVPRCPVAAQRRLLRDNRGQKFWKRRSGKDSKTWPHTWGHLRQSRLRQRSRRTPCLCQLSMLSSLYFE